MKNEVPYTQLTPLRRIFAVSFCFGVLCACVGAASFTAANEYYARQALIQQEQIAWNKR